MFIREFRKEGGPRVPNASGEAVLHRPCIVGCLLLALLLGRLTVAEIGLLGRRCKSL